MADGGVLLVVAAALVDAQDRVLMTRRPAGKALAGLWEFPGGKVEADEVPAAALVRELAEELAVAVEANDLEPVGFAEDRVATGNLVLLLYLVRRWHGEVSPREGQGVRWDEVASLALLPMPAADRPLLAMLRQRLALDRSA